MSYINTNNTINTMKEILNHNLSVNLDYMSEKFNEEQNYALELFKKRIFLEQTIDETISFNKQINFDDSDKNLFLTKTAEELVSVFKLRSDVYASIGYQEEFPDVIDGINFDKYENKSAILYYKNNNTITGTTRLVFDSNEKLPSEEKFSFDNMRLKHNIIGELSRLVINKKTQGLSLEFKKLFAGVHNLFINNNIDIVLCGLKEEHYKLYSKFGGNEIIGKLQGYGELDVSAIILSWDPSQVSNFFKKVFLGNYSIK